MGSRLGLGGAVVAIWVGGTLLGGASAALRTETGRRLVADAAVTFVNDRINGTMTVGEVGGSFLDGLTLDDIAIVGRDGAPLLEIARLQFRYRLDDLLSGRIVLGQLILSRPTATLVQAHPGGPFNVDEIFARGAADTAAPRGRPPLIAFSDVRLIGATVVIRTPSGDGVADGRGGGVRVRRIDRVNAQFPFVRLSSPLPFERAVAIEVAALSASASDPLLDVTAARGLVNVWGDSLTLELQNLSLPATRAAVRGSLAWGSDTLLLNLDVRAARVVSAEVLGLVSELPGGVAGRGDFTIRSISGEVLEFVGERLDLEGTGGGGRLRGRLGMRLGPDTWAQLGTRLELQNFDLEYVRGFLDTLPIAGRLTGRVGMDGPRERMQLTASATFHDSLVEGWPETSVIGEGPVSLGVPGDVVFGGFTVRNADVDMGSVRRLIPAAALEGRVRGRGRLDGAWLTPTFNGELTHDDEPRPQSVVRGSIRLDARGETLGVWAEVDLDPLSLDGLAGSFPALSEVGGAFSGRLGLAGYLDSVAVDATLRGRGGAIDARGVLNLGTGDWGAHTLAVVLRNVDLHAFHRTFPETRLYARGEARGTGFDPTARWRLAINVDTSVVHGLAVDSARAVVALADSSLTIDALRGWGNAFRMDGRGSLGLAAPRRGVLTVSGRVDSLAIFEPFLATWLGPPDTSAAFIPTGGAAILTVRIEGALDDYLLAGSLDARRLERGAVSLVGVRGRGSWAPTARRLTGQVALDSVSRAGFAFSAVEARVAGPPDSLSWFGRGRFGDVGGFIGGGRWLADSTGHTVPVDSLGVLLATGAWFVDTSAVVAVSDSGVDLRGVVFTGALGAGSVSLTGRLPFAGRGDLTGEMRALPIRDLWLLLQRDYEETEGELSGTLRVTGTARAPAIDLTVALRGLRFDTFRAPIVDGRASYRDRRLAGEFTLFRAGEQILQVDVSLPVDLAITGATQRQLPGPLSVRAVAAGVDLAFVDALTPFVRRSAGTLDADFGITGNWERPVLTGRVDVRDGSASFPSLGVRHEGLNIALALSGDTIHVRQLRVRSGQGTAEVAGFVRLEELSRPILDLRVTGREFRSLDARDFLTLTATGDLELKGPLFNATLTGHGTATRGVLYFADLINKNVVNLEDPLFREFVDTTLIKRQGLGPEFENRFLDSLRVDSLRLEMGSDVWLRSGEANIQLSGTVTVNKLRDRYRFTGTLETPRGTYRLELFPTVTREFQVTRGQVRYFGTPDLNADLDIEARHLVRVPRGDNVTVFVHIGGTLYEPKLTLSSDIRPAISETEIISYLLFGAPSLQAFTGAGGAENRRLQDQMLANVVGVLSGQLGASLIGDLGIPLDYLQIRTAGSSLLSAEISVGKQFTIFGTSAFLTASPRICPRQSVVSLENLGASLEFRLSRRWLVAASVDPLRICDVSGEAGQLQLGFDLFWEKRY